MRSKLLAKVCIFNVGLLLSGCSFFTSENSQPVTGTPPAYPSDNVISSPSQLPAFTDQPNEVEIGQDVSDTDSAFIIGSLIDTKTGEIFAFQNVLNAGVKPTITPQSEVSFDDLVDNSLAASVSYLGFLSGTVSSSTVAEVSIVKTSKVTVSASDIDETTLQDFRKTYPANTAVCIGYVDYIISASYLKNNGASVKASGYGASIGGQWYSKVSNSSAYHHIIAIWSPISYVSQSATSAEAPGTAATSIDLSTQTTTAISSGQISVQKIPSTAKITFGPSP